MTGDVPLRSAIAFYLLSGLLFAALDATTKWLVREHALLVVLWARFAGQTLVVTAFALRKCGRRFWSTRRLPLQLARSANLLLTTALVVIGLRFLPLAEVTAVMLTSPIFVVLLSKPLLHEPATPARRIAALAGLAGAVLLLRPGSALFHPAALVLVAGAACHGTYAIATRKLASDPASTTLFYSGLVGFVALSFALPFGVDGSAAGSWADIAPLALLGLLAGAGHGCMIAALNRAPATLLAPFTYAQVVWATAIGLVAFGQLPDKASFGGIFVIVASGVAFALHEARGLPAPRALRP